MNTKNFLTILNTFVILVSSSRRAIAFDSLNNINSKVSINLSSGYEKLEESQYNEDVCLEQLENGECKNSVKKYLLRRMHIENILRSATYLSRVFTTKQSIPSGEKRDLYVEDGVNNFKENKNYGQCVTIGGSEKDIKRFFTSLNQLSLINFNSEIELRKSLQVINFCLHFRELSTQEKQNTSTINNLKDRYLPSDYKNSFDLNSCTPDQVGAIQLEIDILNSENNRSQLNVDSTNMLIQEIALTQADFESNKAKRDSEWDFVFFKSTEMEKQFDNATGKLKRAAAKSDGWFKDRAYMRRYYCDDFRIKKNNEIDEEVYKSIFKEVIANEKNSIELQINDIATQLLSYIDGNKSQSYPSNENYNVNKSSSEKFLDYLFGNDIWLLLNKTKNVAQKCSSSEDFELFNQTVSAPYCSPNQIQYNEPCFQDPKQASPNINCSGYSYPQCERSNRELFLISKLDHKFEDEIPYVSPYKLVKDYKSIKEMITNNEVKSTSSDLNQLMNFITPVVSTGYDNNKNEFKSNYEDFVNMHLPSGSKECFDSYKSARDEFIEEMKNENFINIFKSSEQTKDSYQSLALQNEIQGLAFNLLTLINERKEIEEKDWNQLIASSGENYKNRTILDFKDYHSYILNEVIKAPSNIFEKKEVINNIFLSDEIEKPSTYQNLFVSLISWLKTGIKEHLHDNSSGDSSRKVFYVYLAELVNEYNYLTSLYKDEIESDKEKAESILSDLTKNSENLSLEFSDNNQQNVKGNKIEENNIISKVSQSNIPNSDSKFNINVKDSAQSYKNFLAKLKLPGSLKESILNFSGLTGKSRKKQSAHENRRKNTKIISKLKQAINNDRLKNNLAPINFDKEIKKLSSKFNDAYKDTQNELSGKESYPNNLADSHKEDEIKDNTSENGKINNKIDKKGNKAKAKFLFARDFSSTSNTGVKSKTLGNRANAEILKALKSNKSRYQSNEKDTIFEKISKRYIKSGFEILLEYKQ